MEKQKKRDYKNEVNSITKSNVVHVLEKPIGKEITVHIVNPDDVDSRKLEIVTRTHRGLTKGHIDLAMKLLKRHISFHALFDSVPLKEYYLHAIFYGDVFSKLGVYSSPSFGIYAIETKNVETGKFGYCNYDSLVDFLEMTGMNLRGIHNAALPLIYSGPPNMRKIIQLISASQLTIDGEGTGAYIICDPIYDPIDGKLMLFDCIPNFLVSEEKEESNEEKEESFQERQES